MADRGSIWYIHPYAGGPGIGRYDRAFHLARCFEKQGNRCVIICPSWHHLMDAPQSGGSKEVEGIRLEFLPTPRYSGNGAGRIINMLWFSFQLIASAGRIARHHSPPSLVIASSPHPYAWLAAKFIAWRFGARCFFEVRDLWPLSLIELAGVSPRHPLVKITAWIEKNAYRTADEVVSLLPCTRDYMASLGLPPARWNYIPNGISPYDTPPRDLDIQSLQQVRQWRSEGCVIVVYAGALGLPNNVQSLLSALQRLPPGTAQIRTVIVGRGDAMGELKRLSASDPLDGKVLVHDQIAKSDVRSLLGMADIGYISLRPEPLFRFGVSPNKLFDYMLAAIPVVAAVKAGNDPVSEAGCGRSVDPDDPEAIAAAIRWLADLPASERLALGENGHRYVLASHSYQQLAQRYLQLAGL
ncbi:MAG: glycosyltransferase family 4 protein [Gammaproteobacteria bacterium]|nr:glycosyltransferase family 4 protein [Gammaproteobacteria bacterium]